MSNRLQTALTTPADKPARSTASHQPLIRWAGSKRNLIGVLAAYAPLSYERYVEPFMGSAALYFHLRPASALLSDLNGELIDAFQTIASSPSRVHERLLSIPASKTEYYRIRALSPLQLGRVGRAARFVYLNRFCFNGLYRTDKLGRFNVPYSGSRSGAIPSWEDFDMLAGVLARAQILKCDFKATLQHHARPGDFVYIDPPYAVENRRIFRQYGPASFGIDDLTDLSQILMSLDAKSINFVVSYADCAEARRLFKPWHRAVHYRTRYISGFVRGRRRVREVIYTNMRLTPPHSTSPTGGEDV